MSRQFSLLSNTERLSMNFFIIREVYGYMASIDKIKKSKEKFYDYLEIKPESYDKLIELGVGKATTAIQKLIECGFSDTIFRKDSPTTIKMSDTLFDTAYEYLFNKNITLPDFHDFLAAEIGSIQNTDNTLLVVSVRRLISNIQKTPESTLDNFMDILDDLEFDGHIKQKDLLNDIKNLHQEYKEILSDSQNQDE